MLSEVRFEGVHKIFGTETAVEDLNLWVNAGEFLVLVGPSGCGKTTTLRMLAGLERPSYGRILIGDKLVNNVSPRFRDEAMAMGDRIAVMNSGRLQQVDAPETLYDNPANIFVAGFIGSPRMNFVRGTLTTTRGVAAVEFLGVTTPLSSRAKLTAEAADGAVTVGLRPEDLMWRRAAPPESTLTLSAEVDVVEPMGHEAYVTAVCAGETVTSRFPPRSGVRTRERIELALNPARLHLFDARSGNTILQRPVAGGAELPRSVGEARVDESEEGRSERQHEPHTRSAQSRAEEIS